MYQLILADDETEIRQGLKEVIPFEALGFTVVGESANGMEALQLCEQLEPDLLITDIRMPLMDGLTLCRRVREAVPATQFIILSGYDDFEYARQAIEVKTMGYLLKPISAAEFAAVLKQAKIDLDEEFHKRTDIRRLREHFRESLPLLRETLMGSLLSGGVAADRALASARKYGEDLQAQSYAVALVRPAEAEDGAGIGDPELRIFAVRNILAEVLEARAQGYRIQIFMYNSMLAVLFLLSSTDDTLFSDCLHHLEEARKTVRHYLDFPLFLGVSSLCSELSRTASAARQAATALDQCVLSGQEQTLCISDLQRNGQAELTADELLLRKLSNLIKSGDGPQSTLLLAELMDACRHGHPSPKAWQAYLLEILLCILHLISELSLSRDTLDEPLEQLTQLILCSCPSVDSAQDALQQLITAVLSAADRQRKTSSRLLADEAEQYLRENYAQEDMTLEKLCLHLHISPSYFSMVFKKETRKTFHQYLTELRMDKALTLLRSTELKTAEIAQQVGLPDPSYFSYCFKKHFGHSPSKARGK